MSFSYDAITVLKRGVVLLFCPYRLQCNSAVNMHVCVCVCACHVVSVDFRVDLPHFITRFHAAHQFQEALLVCASHSNLYV